MANAPGAAQNAAGTEANEAEGARGAAIPVVPSATPGAASAGSGAQAGSEQATETQAEAPPVDTDLPLPPADLATLLWAVGGEGIGPGLFNNVRNIGVDASGVIYVVEYTSDAPTRVQRFAADGSFIGQWFTVDQPLVNDVVADRNGKLYLLQSGPSYLYDDTSGSKLGSLEFPRHDPWLRHGHGRHTS